ncbi:nitrous oxide reductase accessory protein NosL [Candidatus Parabeggiatoa sp. HSG14]|uniref:nitrous oxide reductase accessory protein NosL n=1 Tax=Candidatus Parabeggiatoa sp. HSG14 TaxID=3055593 RepID=UPI0025A6DD83|nr:nitrous oxide reductase accessory protein NosL [Thiotrichales bacterium HSG14]
MRKIRYKTRFFYLLTSLILFSACDDGGIVNIKWDRDSCERCRMVISDPHFAAQLRGGPKNKAYLFDDIGCAVHWLKKQPWGEDENVKIWVKDYRDTEKWLDARKAYYVSQQITPMDFGFGATKKPVKGSIDFETAKTQIMAKTHRHRFGGLKTTP